jgi:transcription elongation GreA/GreB family factor
MDKMYKIKVEEPLHDVVTFGSIVTTDKKISFVSVENFQVDEMKLLGLSIDAPMYQAMEGKKDGESFSFQRNEYLIKDIY